MATSGPILPPICESHSSFLTTPRTLLLEYELALSVNDFFIKFWANPSFWAKYGGGMGWAETKVEPWQQTQPPGCLERKCTWIIQLAAFGVGKSTPVVQIHKARFKKKDFLVLQLSSCTPEVMFGTDFSIEQQWEITSTGTNSSILKVSSGVHWSNEPWGVGMMKGTIAERSADETKKSACHFVALIEQVLKSEIEEQQNAPSQPKHSPRESKLKRPLPSVGANSLEPKKTRRPKEDLAQILGKGFDAKSKGKRNRGSSSEETSDESTESESEPHPTHKLAPSETTPITKTQPDEPPSPGGILPVLSHIGGLLKSFLMSPFLQGICLIILLISSWSILSQIALFEGLLAQPNEDAYAKVLFLESFIEKLSQNISGNPNVMKEHYELWKTSQELESELAQWQQQLEEMIYKLRTEKEPLNSVQQSLFKKLDGRLKDSEATNEKPTGWVGFLLSYFFYSLFILFWVIVGILVILRQFGVVALQLPFVVGGQK